MISEPAGDMVKVIGSSMAMVAVGPIPGSTPIRVPSNVPMKQLRMLTGRNAVWSPVRRLWNRSICGCSARDPRPEGAQLQAEPVSEDEHAEDREAQTERRRKQDARAATGEGRHKNGERRRGHQTEAVERQPEK